MHSCNNCDGLNMQQDRVVRQQHPIWCIAMLLLLLVCLSPQARSYELFGVWGVKDTAPVTLEVADPYIEMHTGPGRGYPVFNVIERGESVEILTHKTNWYKVRSMDGKTGWTKAAQLAHTLKPTGEPVDLPEVNHGDYLKSSWRVGFTGGQFEGADSFSILAGYRPLSRLGVELEWGKIFGNSVTSDIYGINILFEPMPEWIATPFITAGAGRISFDSRQKVVVEDIDTTDYISAGAGVNYYIGRNFVLRGEYRRYSLSNDDDTVGLNSWRLGFSTFF